MKDAEEPEATRLRLVTVDLDGEEASCVIEPSEGAANEDGHGATLLTALFQLMKDRSSGVSRSDWREAVGLVGIKKGVFDRALKGLVSRDAVTKSGTGRNVRYSPAVSYAKSA